MTDPQPPDPREPYGRIVNEIRLAYEKEREAARGDRGPALFVKPWEERHPDQQELDMRIASAVAVQAVADAKAHDERARFLLAALGTHRGAIFDALKQAAADAEWESDKRRYRNALKALGGDEEGAEHV